MEAEKDQIMAQEIFAQPLVAIGAQGGNKDSGVTYGFPDCAVQADSDAGAGAAGSSKMGYGIVGIHGDLPVNAPPLAGGTAGVWGSSKQGPGVLGISENNDGVRGKSSSGAGVSGYSDTEDGVYGFTNGRGANGVFGENHYDGPASTGVLGMSGDSGQGQGIGVKGLSGRTGVLGAGGEVGVEGLSHNGVGVKGTSTTSTGIEGNADDGIGVKGNASRGIGVQGNSDSGVGVEGNSGSFGVWGLSRHGAAVLGLAGDGYAIAGLSGPNGYAGYFDGPVFFTGPLEKPGGAFKIDHPLDPANQYLQHSFVESPDMKNVYDGVAKLNRKGEALVKLPNWFGALNKDFRYLLTAIGKPGPNLYIAKGISDNRFKIAGGNAGMKVSWQVTGIRQDAWANAHRIAVEEKKVKKERGRFLHPELYGKSEQKSIGWARNPELMQKMKASRKTLGAPKGTR